MMWRFLVLFLTVIGGTTFAGCQGQSRPEPLTPEQESELQEHMQQTQDEERSQFAKEQAETGAGTR